jgi:surfactin synthase thioesterase subunit
MQSTEDVGLWLRRFHRSSQQRPRLVCFPHAGGSASFFRPMAAALTSTVDVVALQYPGRQDRHAEPCVDDLGGLADRIHAVLSAELRADPGRPPALFGHSMGALLAFEVVRRLEREATVMPSHLFVSGREAAWMSRPLSRLDDASILAEVAVLSGTDNRFLADEELRGMVLPALRGDYLAVAGYRCAANVQVSCPVTALLGDRDPKVTVEGGRRWCDHTTGAFEHHVFEGGHFYLNTREAEVCQLITRRLEAPLH